MYPSKVLASNKLNPLFKRNFVALAHRAKEPEVFKKSALQVPVQLPWEKENFYWPLRETNELRYCYDKHQDKIGHGFFATVYQAFDSLRMERVAVKVVDKKRVHKQVFKQELRVMEQLKSSLGLAILDSPLAIHTDVVETKTELQFVFKLFNGGDLCDDLIDNGAMSEDETKRMMRRLVPGLFAMHKNGFIHRDIKAENILLTDSIDRSDRYDSCTLTDFGYARRIEESDEFSNPAGTFGFVAPEVLSTRSYSPACDIWSLGAVLFTAKAAYQPFPHLENDESLVGKTSVNLARKEIAAINHYTTEERWSEEMNRSPFVNASAEFKDLLRKMLMPNPSERISAEEILEHPWMQS